MDKGWPRYLTDLAEILLVVLVWGPNYEMDTLEIFNMACTDRWPKANQYGGSKDFLSLPPTVP